MYKVKYVPHALKYLSSALFFFYVLCVCYIHCVVLNLLFLQSSRENDFNLEALPPGQAFPCETRARFHSSSSPPSMTLPSSLSPLVCRICRQKGSKGERFAQLFPLSSSQVECGGGERQQRDWWD